MGESLVKGSVRRGNGRGLRLVEEIGTVISQSDDAQSALERLVALVADTLDMEVCSLYTYSESTRCLVLLATHGLAAGSAGLVSMGVNEGLTGFVVQKREPVIAIDALLHPRYKYFPETGEERYHSFLGVPILDQGEPLGVLVLQTSRRRRFNRAEVRVLKAVALQAGGLLVRLRLLQSLETKEEERRGYHQRMLEAIKQLGTTAGDGPLPLKTTRRLAGVAASPGFGIGRAHLFRPRVSFAGLRRRRLLSAKKETTRFREAVGHAVKDVERLKQRLRTTLPEFDFAVLDAHKLMLLDEEFAKSVEKGIREGASAETALERTVSGMIAHFRGIDDSYLRERGQDVNEIGRRVLGHLIGVEERDRSSGGSVVLIAEDLTVSDILLVPRQRLKGIVIATGSATSHASILAKSLEIPLVAGVRDAGDVIREGDPVIADGNAGTVYVNPGSEVRREYERMKREYRAFSRELDTLRDQPAVTRDGVVVELLANIGLLSDLQVACRSGVGGVGLYRTEFAFLTRRDFLTEEEQVDLYTRVVRGLPKRPVTIRTLDLGADKYPPYLHFPEQSNPVLGWRSTRISLDMPDVFKAQLRAILRTSAFGDVRIMFPMIASVDELLRVKELLAEAGDELRLGGVAFNPEIPTGIMVEVPSAVQMADRLIEEVDFFSIGTNDLTQYLLAVDRNNPKVAPLYDSLHPAVLRSVAHTVHVARDAGKGVSLCGETAGDPFCTLVLIGLGLRQLSMSSFFVPVIKRLIRSVDCAAAEQLAREVLTLGTTREVKARILGVMRELALADLVEMYH